MAGNNPLAAFGPMLGMNAPAPVLGNTAIAEQAPLNRQTNFLEAIKKLGLTEQEQNLYKHHLMNMAAGAQVANPDGGTSTILQANIEGPGGRFYDVPTVWDGKIMPVREGVKKAIATRGWDYWPSYATPDEADSRYMQYHEYMARDMPSQGWDAIAGDGQ